MRDIKFRLWDHGGKRMAPACKLDWHWGTLWASIPHSKADGTVPEEHALEVIEVHSGVSELMEYTGLHDKAGKEIYEGDVLGLNVNLMPRHWLFVVEYLEVTCPTCKGIGSFRLRPLKVDSFYKDDPIIFPSTCEVIGNIYENPELVAQP